MVTIHQQIEEGRQHLRELANLVAKGGKGQSLAQHRHEIQQAINTTLEWCRDNAERLRAFEASQTNGNPQCVGRKSE